MFLLITKYKYYLKPKKVAKNVKILPVKSKSPSQLYKI